MTVWLWVGFAAVILVLLGIDLGVLNRRPHVVSTKEALAWTGFWVVLALMFNGLIFAVYEHQWFGLGGAAGDVLSGREAATHFFTAYLVEKSLSLDNVFVIATIFAFFRVPAAHQHRVLFWGVIGAAVMRGVLIAAGMATVRRFSWLLYVLGIVLLVAAFKLFFAKEDSPEPSNNPLVRLARRWFPITNGYHGGAFVVRQGGRFAMTPLCVALISVESADLLFAVDSIPAVFAVTLDPFIGFSSNVFAILGLRCLYFALAAVMERFRYLKVSLVLVLAFVGTKLLLAHHVPIPNAVSLSVISGLLLLGVMASLFGAQPAVSHDEHRG